MNRRLQEEIELEKSVRRFREKFHGKVTLEKATVLMRRYNNDHAMVAKCIILMKDQELDEEDEDDLRNDQIIQNVVRRVQAEEQRQLQAQRNMQQENARAALSQDDDIQQITEMLRVLPLTEKNVRMFDNAQQNQIPFEDRQFACEPCDRVWWRRVPTRKKVSRCQSCKVKYDPVPQDKMWGVAEFMCPHCHRSFRGFAKMDVLSPCFSCRMLLRPIRILPPTKGTGQRTRNTHSCCAEDCFNRRNPYVPGTHCVHPRSRQLNRKPRVVHPSLVHISTGSTVATCLSQGNLVEDDLDDLIVLDLQSIPEEESEDDDDENGGANEG
ncbi:shiftless antiviral inhibitor of ribosomal frameshifting protein homolog [Erpetoichthys calabaricus]|uniref:Shiftless antiviral inhibitor of ribosomal frameshifting n=1 Tax=Erpetoichthys calabaricus TaxID=27687 RepID=A0A8C4T5P5_ERPCA|nr:shiftless antiviral inhibitor of ribosomal frameshifting protein homolog [Erpetoichthys calabaricus]